MDEFIFAGDWGENFSWQFYKSTTLPPRELCTSASCIAVLEPTGDIVLTRTWRGWEFMGGHIEPGESIEAAMIREALEEGGFRVESYELIGYRKVTAKAPATARQTGLAYPFPVSYIPWFLARSRQPLVTPGGDEGEILEARAMTHAEIYDLHLNDEPILRAVLPLIAQPA